MNASSTIIYYFHTNWSEHFYECPSVPVLYIVIDLYMIAARVTIYYLVYLAVYYPPSNQFFAPKF